ncbi:hypothetical protein C6P40_005013 [Pichia californica]|uniref:C2H2-type domain-containing protein n=1 Tax=Pichia californica TaxID=460514 RepID=A0A9P6WPZ4_9ASCO|nr:hypothetical protein C6P42_004001 [[Candida] californica]KAG0691094.1 hypothetical protein C6P40_005013 [[Candida] californica]
MSLKRQRESDDDDIKNIHTKIVKIPISEIDPVIKPNILKNKSKTNAKPDTSICCSLPPLCSQNPQIFANRKQYELHYISSHTNTCSECSKNFPTSKLLDLHIGENHDPFIRIKLQKGEPVFGCFVEGCDRVFKDHKKRRLHLIDKHDYPKDFIFSIVDRGIKMSDTSLIKKNTQSYGVWKPA